MNERLELLDNLTYFGEWHNIPLLYCTFWYHPTVNRGILLHFKTSRELALWVINRKQYLFVGKEWLETLGEQVKTTDQRTLLMQLRTFYDSFPEAKKKLQSYKNKKYNLSSNDELSRNFQEIINTIHLITPFDQYCMIAEQFYLREFENYLRAQLKKIHQEKQFNEFRSVLTTPTEPTSPQLEELGLLKLALKNRKGELTDKDVANHVEEFGWLPIFLFGEEWDEKFVHSEVERLTRDAGLKEKMKHIENYGERQKQNVAEFTAKLPDKSLWPELMREIGFVRNEAETIISLGTKVLQPIYLELNRRLDCEEYDLACLTPEEIISALDGELNVKAIARQRKAALIYSTTVENMHVISGAQALRKFFDVYTQPNEETASNLSGTCASMGKVQGKVKIIKVIEDMKKFEEGDILVAEATCIDYVPIMRKAAAIVTSMGGLTSHAAIVSRELAIPCIVGVSNIHKTLKDGQIVEVDADNGTIRKL